MTKDAMMRAASMLLVVLAVLSGACTEAEDGDQPGEPSTAEAAGAGESEVTVATVGPTSEVDTTDFEASGATGACGADAIVEVMESGEEPGTLDGMSDDPFATAAANNPVLTTLTRAVEAAGLTASLDEADALTVFAPTDCAFAVADPAAVGAAMADPDGLLTATIGLHVIQGVRLASADLDGEFTTTNGEVITAQGGELVAGQAQIVVPDVQTANATVHLIDTVITSPGPAPTGR